MRSTKLNPSKIPWISVYQEVRIRGRANQEWPICGIGVTHRGQIFTEFFWSVTMEYSSRSWTPKIFQSINVRDIDKANAYHATDDCCLAICKLQNKSLYVRMGVPSSKASTRTLTLVQSVKYPRWRKWKVEYNQWVLQNFPIIPRLKRLIISYKSFI